MAPDINIDEDKCSNSLLSVKKPILGSNKNKFDYFLMVRHWEKKIYSKVWQVWQVPNLSRKIFKLFSLSEPKKFTVANPWFPHTNMEINLTKWVNDVECSWCEYLCFVSLIRVTYEAWAFKATRDDTRFPYGGSWLGSYKSTTTSALEN